MNNMRTKSNKTLIALLGIATVLPCSAFAQGLDNGLGSALNNVAFTTSFTFVLSVGSYVIGVALCMWGLMRLKAWVDGQTNFSEGVWRIVGGALMIAIPDFLSKVISSFFGSWQSGTSANYNRISNLTTNYTNSGGWLGLDQAMVNFVSDIYLPGKVITSWAAWIVGFGCMINGTYRLAQSGQAASGRAPSVKGTAGYIVGGAMLLATTQLMDSITTSIFGDADPGTFSSLTYAPPGINADQVNNVIAALFAFIEIMGWIAFVRGIFLLVKLAQGGADKSHAHAFTHIVFGAAAVNMYGVVKIIQSSLGIGLVN